MDNRWSGSRLIVSLVQKSVARLRRLVNTTSTDLQKRESALRTSLGTNLFHAQYVALA